jgi:cytochrome c553
MKTISLLLILLASPAFADRCFQQQRVQFVQQVPFQVLVIRSPVYYGVGNNLQYQALQKLIESQKAPQLLPRQAPMTATTMIEQKCMKCHSQSAIKTNDAPLISMQDGLSSSFITKSLRAIATGKMPKNGKLTNAEKATLMQELLDSEKEL